MTILLLFYPDTINDSYLFWKFYEPGKTIEQAEKDTAEQVVELDPSEASASDKDKDKEDKGQDAQGIRRLRSSLKRC